MVVVRVVAASLILAAVMPSPRVAAQNLVEPGEADCSTPRRALLTWLGNLQEEDEHPEQAARCFDWGAVRIREQARRADIAHRLKYVLDARGLYVQMEDVPDEEEPADVTRVAPFEQLLPVFYLVRKESQWVVSAETIRAVPDLYSETFTVDLDAYLDRAPSWLRDRVLGFAWWQVIALAFVLLVAFALRWVVTTVVRSYGAAALTQMVKRLDRTLVQRAAEPVGTTVMILALMYVVPLLRFGVGFNRFVVFGLRVGAAVTFVLILYRLIDVGADVFGKQAEDTDTKLDDQLVPLIRKSLKVVVVIVGVIFVLQNMEVNIGSLLAGVSLGGLAFSLAARDTVANLFGSVSIFADQPFQVGDWVVMNGVEGIVEEVGMRSTRVRTFYRSLVSIPNSKVADGVIDNYGSRDARRTFLKVGLQYDTTAEQMEAFCDGVRGILAANPAVKKDSYYVVFSGFGDSSLEVMLYFFFVVDSWAEELRQRHLVFLELLRLAKEVGVSFAFPTRTLHLATQAPPKERPAAKVPDEDALGAAVLAFGPGGRLARPAGPRISHGWYPGAALGPGSDPDADRSDSRDDAEG
ncbi:MAG: mechanosensitive ion channel family protein [Sandaracinaceae bacterium]